MSEKEGSLKLVNSKTAKGLPQKLIVEWVFAGSEPGSRRSLSHVFTKKAIIEMANDEKRGFTQAFKSYVWENHDYAAYSFIEGEDHLEIANPLMTKEEMEKL